MNYEAHTDYRPGLVMEWCLIIGSTHTINFQGELRFDAAVVPELAHALGGADILVLEPSPTPKPGSWFQWRGIEWEGTQLLIIHHKPTGRFWVHDWCDAPSGVNTFAAHPDWQGTWLGMAYQPTRLDTMVNPTYRDRVWPGWNLGFTPAWVKYRPHVERYSRMLWAGTIFGGRELVHHLNSKVAMVYNGRLDVVLGSPRERWLEFAREYRAVLCLPGGSAWNNREVDCWGSNIPTILIKHEGRLQGDPDCFVQVDVGPLDEKGGPLDLRRAAQAIEDAWRGLPPYRLHEKARDALVYYKGYCTPEAVAKGIAGQLSSWR